MSPEIQYHCYPRTRVPPEFAEDVVEAFREHKETIATRNQDDGLKSDRVLQTVRPELEEIGFEVEEGNRKEEKIFRPVLFGANGEPQLQYEVDGYHPEWECGLEVEAGRA